MPRGRTESTLSLQQRKQRSFEWFTKGFTNEYIAERIGIHPSTVSLYRREYEDALREQAASNPQLLIDMLQNTVRALQELDEVRRHAWEEYEASTRDVEIECPHCEEAVIIHGQSSPTTRNALLGTITKAQEQRGKLLGLFGVKAEFFAHVNTVHRIQTALLAFMRQNLCDEDKRKLEDLLTTEFGDNLRSAEAIPVIPREVLEAG